MTLQPQNSQPPHTATHEASSLTHQLTELQRENSRLQRLVSELLLRNQQLRTQLSNL